MRIFVDTNLLLDVLARREPFPPETARVWTLAETGACEALVSAISFNNVFQIVRKARDGPPRAGHWSCCATSLPASLQTSAS